MNSKSLGQLVEAKFQYLALEKGFGVAKPYGDNSKYDFILDVEGKLLKVQIKSTSKSRGDKSYQVKACYGTKTTKTKYTKNDIDFLIAYIIGVDIWYIVPVSEISSPCLDLFPYRIGTKSKYEKYKENWNILKT